MIRWHKGNAHIPAIIQRIDPPDDLASTRAVAALLTLAGKVLGATESPLFEELMHQTVRALPGQQALHSLRHTFHYIPRGQKSYARHGDTTSELYRSLIYRRPLSCIYTGGAGTPEPLTVEPWTLILYLDSLYVLAWVRQREALRTLAVDRMEDARYLQREPTFRVPEGHDPATHFAEMGLWPDSADKELVRLAFPPRIARSMRERDWPGQRGWEVMPDGRHQLSLKLTWTPEVEGWIRHYGTDVELLAPPRRRAWMQAQAQALASLYG